MAAHPTVPFDLHVLMFAIGSGGDVHPSIGIGRALRRRGHRITFAVNSFFEPAVRRAGLEFLSTGTAEEYLRATQDPDLWRLGKGFRVLFRVMLEGMRRQYDIIAERFEPERTVVVAPSSAFGARIANEKLGVPLVNLHLQPMPLRSLREQPGVAVPAIMKPLLPPMRAMFLAALDRWVLDPPLLPELNAFRAELHLQSITRAMNTWVHSPQRVIGLWPEWFAPLQPDWPPQLRLTGFPLFDEAETRDLPADAPEFLNEGPPPVAFTLGTAMRASKEFFTASARACAQLGRRGVLLTQFREQVPTELPEGIRHFDYLPFSYLLPRCAALVHHGGIGTIAQALRAGVPQLITPMNFDQPANAARVRALGTGDVLRLRSYTAESARGKLDRMLSDAAIRRKSLEICRRFTGDPVSETCDLIEDVMTVRARTAVPARGN